MSPNIFLNKSIDDKTKMFKVFDDKDKTKMKSFVN